MEEPVEATKQQDGEQDQPMAVEALMERVEPVAETPRPSLASDGGSLSYLVKDRADVVDSPVQASNEISGVSAPASAKHDTVMAGTPPVEAKDAREVETTAVEKVVPDAADPVATRQRTSRLLAILLLCTHSPHYQCLSQSLRPHPAFPLFRFMRSPRPTVIHPSTRPSRLPKVFPRSTTMRVTTTRTMTCRRRRSATLSSATWRVAPSMRTSSAASAPWRRVVRCARHRGVGTRRLLPRPRSSARASLPPRAS